MKLHFYEIKVLTDEIKDAGDVSIISRTACEQVDHGMYHVGTTIHNRPSYHGDANQGVAAIIVASRLKKDKMVDAVDAYGGIMARLYGLPTLGAQEFGETTLNLKNSDETVEEFIENFKGVEDDTFTVKGKNEDNDEFTTEGENE